LRKNKVVQIRLTESQHERLKLYANTKELTISELIREFINRAIRRVKA